MPARIRCPSLSRRRFEAAAEKCSITPFRTPSLVIDKDSPRTENDTATKTTRNDLFKLPCELRDAVYEYLLPSNSEIDYIGGPVPSGTFNSEDVWVANMCKADLRFSFDLRRIEQRPRPICRFVVSPYGCHLPVDLNVSKYKCIEIYFEHYELIPYLYHPRYRAYQPVPQQLENMKGNLDGFVDSLRVYEKLPHVRVMFRDEPLKGIHGDPHWTKQILGLVDHAFILATHPGTGRDRRMTLVWYLLEPLLRLPPARTASIQSIGCLIAHEESTPFRTFPYITDLNGSFMSALCSTLRLWLEGSRDLRFEDLLNEATSDNRRWTL